MEHPDGRLSLTATVVDAAGNATTTSVMVLVDNTAPVKALVTPTAGQVVRGTMPITAQAQDANLDTIEIMVDGRSLGTSATLPFAVTFDTRTRLDGACAISVQVRDLAGNTSWCSVSVVVDNLSAMITPKQLNLKASKSKDDVKVEVRGCNTALLVPVASHAFELRVPGGAPVPLAKGSVHDGKLDLRFGRQPLVNSLRAGVAVGAIRPGSIVSVDLVADGLVIDTMLVQIKSAERDDDHGERDDD